MHNRVYAFDANHPEISRYMEYAAWTLADLLSGMKDGLLYDQEIGCLSTLGYRWFKGCVYLVCATDQAVLDSLRSEPCEQEPWIRKAVTITGSKWSPAPAILSVTDTTAGQNLVFNPAFELQRAALTLANKRIYVTFGSHRDEHPYHGWAFAYDAETLSQVALWCSSPNSFGGGLWGAEGEGSV